MDSEEKQEISNKEKFIYCKGAMSACNNIIDTFKKMKETNVTVVSWDELIEAVLEGTEDYKNGIEKFSDGN